VTVTDVRTLNVRVKERRPGGLGRGRSGRRSGWKKAFVTLKDGDAIPIFEG
jgi:ribosomal protein L23